MQAGETDGNMFFFKRVNGFYLLERIWLEIYQYSTLKDHIHLLVATPKLLLLQSSEHFFLSYSVSMAEGAFLPKAYPQL